MATQKYDLHVFTCINERQDGRKSCGESHGLQLIQALKEAMQVRNLPQSIRINKAGCLDVCAYGAALVVYPEGIWYGGVQLSDIPEIVTSHLVNGQPVERLRIDFNRPARKWLQQVDESRKSS